MIIVDRVDRALAERAAAGNPIRLGMIGAGSMARGVALQIFTAVPGIRLCAIANRTLDNARLAYTEAGQEPKVIDSAGALASAIGYRQPAITEDWRLLTESPDIDVILEVTGSIHDAAEAVCSAIDYGKHIVLMNAELDGTVGPLLKARADVAGVVYTNVDGDQSGVEVTVPNTIARAALFNDAACAPVGGLMVEVIAAAKIDLMAGTVLDDPSHDMTYGLAENADVVRSERMLPIGIAAGCRLKRDVPKDGVLRYEDVEIPADRLIDRLRAEQERLSGPVNDSFVAQLAFAVAG